MSELQIQKPAPKFKGTAVINGEFKEIKLEDYAGKYLVLFFYPLDLWVHNFYLFSKLYWKSRLNW